MIDSADILEAARARYESLVVTTTPAIALEATATQFIRTDGGSFVAEKFARGMQFTPAGFGVNAPRVITAVAADRLTVDVTPTGGGPLAPDAAAPGRSLVVGLPEMRLWEGESIVPKAGIPYAEMQYAGGPRRLVSMGDGADGGEVDLRPQIIFYVHVKTNSDAAARRYADATLRLFPPGLILAAPDSEQAVYVFDDPAPYDSQIQASSPGFVTIPIIVPLWVTTFNSIT